VTPSHRTPGDEADETLMRRVQADDPEAFGMLYDRYSAPAYRVAAWIGHRRHADDITQEAFVSVWCSRASYSPEQGTVAGWMMGIVRNRAIDVLRQQRRHDSRRCGPDETVEEQVTSSDALDERVAERDGAARLRTALVALPVTQREVIALAYFGELTAVEIAGRLSLPVGTVKGRMRLGLDKLRLAAVA
jgi:RNA polymerase sigma-70 factor, ECF subfamily